MFVRAYGCVPVQSGVPRGTAALGQAGAPLPVEDAKQEEARARRDLPVGLLKVSEVAEAGAGTLLVGPEGLSVQGLPTLPDHLGRRASPGMPSMQSMAGSAIMWFAASIHSGATSGPMHGPGGRD